jgi:transposase
MLEELLKYVLPQETVEYFELAEIKQAGEELHLHPDEKPVPPPEYSHIELSGNGFYASSTIKDFPLRDRKVLLEVRRRRWIDACGKSYSRDWDLVAQGTRYSKELASFLKEKLGYTPDTGSNA